MHNWERLSREWVIQEIGLPQHEYVEDLARNQLNVSTLNVSDIVYRVAPSLVTRSECELLAVSAPRFSIRATLRDGSFFNLRRLTFLIRSCRNIPCGQHSVSDELIRNRSYLGSAIADSLLIPPSHRFPSSRWHFLSIQLGRSYGEQIETSEGDVSGTPFMRQMLLGGGMCAQAVSFMANAIMIEHAKGLFGPAEVTALSDGQLRNGRRGRVQLSGMPLNSISDFLSSPSVNLHSWTGRQNIVGCSTEESSQIYLKSIKGFLMSGLPVIVQLDYRSCADVGAYQESIGPGLHNYEGTLPHAIILVGCSLDGTLFVAHDPSDLPFQQFTSEELLKIAESGGKHILVAAPNSVRLPLVCSRSGASGDYHLGIFELAQLCKHYAKRQYQLLYPTSRPAVASTDEFRLLNTHSNDWMRTLCRGDKIASRAICLLAEWLKSQYRGGNDWFWSQHRRYDDYDLAEAIVWFDASAESNRLRGAASKLPIIAVARPRGTDDWEVLDLASKTLRASIVTSFSTQSVSSALSLLSREEAPTVEGIEWYAMMQTDIEGREIKKLKRELNLQFETAVEFMSACFRNETLSTAFTGKMLNKLSESQHPTIAIATFVPSLSMDPQTSGAKIGIQALAFIAQFCSRLAKEQKLAGIISKRRRIVIEIVGGSRVAGIVSNNDEEYVASFYSANEARENLIRNLRTIIKLGGDASDDIVWAIELEPGPLFTVRDWNSLKSLARRLHESETLRENVGLNLDISHWRMSQHEAHDVGIDIERIRGCPSVFSRIAHAHISGHTRKAHFGDLPLGDPTELEQFEPWLKLLRERATFESAPIPFSGFVSLELEASKSPHVVAAAVREFTLLMSTQYLR